MKKIFVSIISVFLLASILLSCGKTPLQTDEKRENQNSGLYNIVGQFCETPTRVIFKGNSKLYYFNKLDGESYVFCFNPLCKHGDDCISSKFMNVSFTQPIVYHSNDNRLYALRGSKFLSMSFDGSDVKILYSFSDVDTLEDETYDRAACAYLQVYQNYAFMTALNNETGNRDFYRYDIKNDEMLCLTGEEKTFQNVEYFFLDEDILYFCTIEEAQLNLYCADLDFQEATLVQTQIEGDFTNAIFDGENFYMRVMKTKMKNGYERSYIDGIATYNIITNQQTVLCQLDHDNVGNLLAATDRYLYYHLLDEVFLGTKKRYSGLYEIENDHSKVYRYDMLTGETKIVLDDLTIQTDKLFLMENQVILYGKTFIIREDGTADETLPHAMIADIDENGMFVNVQMLEE